MNARYSRGLMDRLKHADGRLSDKDCHVLLDCIGVAELLEACKELTTAILAIRVRLQTPRDEREQKAVDELYRLFAKGKAAIATVEAQ